MKLPLARLPEGTCHGHVGPILLGRVNALFEADAVSVVEAPHGCDADHDTALAQQSPDFFKRDVRLLPNQIEQPRGMGLKNRTTVTANRARRCSSVKPPLPDPFNCAAGAHREY